MCYFLLLPFAWERWVYSLQFWHQEFIHVLRCLGSAGRGHGCRETLYSRGASATCSPAHTQPSHSVLRDWPALAQQLLFIAFYGNSVIDVIIQDSWRDFFWSIYPSRKWDRWEQEKPGACSTKRQFVNCGYFVCLLESTKFVTCVSNLLLIMSLQSADRKIRANVHFQRKRKITPSTI